MYGVPLNMLPLRTQGKASNDKYGTVTDPAKLLGESDPDQCLNYEATLLKTSWQTLNLNGNIMKSVVDPDPHRF